MEKKNTIKLIKILDNNKKNKDVKFLRTFFSSGLFFGCIVILLKTMLDNGTKNWVPTMIMESYSMAPTISGVITALIFICNISGILLVVRLSDKIKNEYSKMLVYFSVALPALVLMQFTGIIPVWLIVISLMISTTMMYAINNTIVLLADGYSKIGYTGTASSILNAAASFGVVIASFGYGYLSEHFGWGAVTGLWLALAVLAIILNLISIKPWDKFKKTFED